MAEGEKIINANIEDQMKTAYIDYSMSVIVSRALPDVRDGLKPVHRRVLYGMMDLGLLSNRGFKKSARIVGEVLGKYHPHGDTSVYDAMVRMAQIWSLRYPLVNGQGNFGSLDGDSPAAMRYTEAKLRKIAEEMLADIDKNTVDFQYNFDDTLKEPTVLPSRIPGLLVNGASGIAVGMATNMPPHNISEVIDGHIAYIDNRDITIDELMQYIKGPDFPLGGIIYGHEGVKEAFRTGRGRILVRGESTIETDEKTGRESIIFTSIPYQTNKAELIKRAADLVVDKKLEGISDLRDESDKGGVRIVFELKRDAITDVVLNNIYKHTWVQSAFNVNNIALVNGKPQLLNLKDLIAHFVDFRHEVVVRRTQYELEQAEKRAHILEGLLIAIDNLDEVIKLIRASRTPDDARDGLMEQFELTEIQAKAILDMRLQRLTGLERDKLKEEYEELLKQIDYLKSILADEGLRMDIIKKELLEIKEEYGDEPRTDIIYNAEDFKIEDTIADENVVITISHHGYIKRTFLSDYRRQNRGGKGSKGSGFKDEDFIEYLYVASMHNYMLFFTEQGRCYWLRVFEIPEGSKISRGRAIQNLIGIPPEDRVKTFLKVKNLSDEEYVNSNFILLCTKKGVIKKTPLEAFSRPRQNGINAITIREGDELYGARLTNGQSEILIANKSGQAIRFNEGIIRSMGRTAAGVRGIRQASADDEVVGLVSVKDKEDSIMVVSEKGYGKRSKLDDYRITNRGGKGVKTMNITEKTGNLIALLNVNDTEDLMIINKSGLVIRLAVADLRVMGRATQGVRLIALGKDSIADVSKVPSEKEDEEEILENKIANEENQEEPNTEEPSSEESNTGKEESEESEESEEPGNE